MGTSNYKWRFIVGESHENIGVSEFPLQCLITGEYTMVILQEIHIVYPDGVPLKIDYFRGLC